MVWSQTSPESWLETQKLRSRPALLSQICTEQDPGRVIPVHTVNQTLNCEVGPLPLFPPLAIVRISFGMSP